MEEVTKDALVDLTGIDSDFESEFDVMNKIYDFEVTINNIFADGVDEDEFIEFLNTLMTELDEHCRHAGKVVKLNGKVFGSTKSVERENIEAWRPAIFTLKDQLATSFGYGYQKNVTSGRWEIGYMFTLNGNSEINNEIPFIYQENTPKVFGKINEVQIDYIRPIDEIIKSLSTNVPEIIHDIDEALLNADNIQEAIERLGEFRLNHEQMGHLSSVELNEILIYIGSVLDLSDTAVPYIVKIKNGYLKEDLLGEPVLTACEDGVDDGGSKEIICFVNGMSITDIGSIV